MTALLVVASVLPLILLSALMLERERAATRAANVALLEARVDEVGHTLEAMYRGFRDTAARAARDPDVIAFCAASAEPRALFMPKLREHMGVFQGADQAIRGIGLADRSGTIIAATETGLIGLSISHREYFQRARGGVEAVSDVYISQPATGRVPSVAFAMPVMSRDGEVVGVYTLWLRAQAVWDVMRAANGTAGRGSFFALFDPHGFRIGHSVNDKLLFHPSAPVPDETARAILADRRFQERTAELLAAVIPFPLHEIQGYERRIFRRPASPTNQETNLAVARRFPALDATLVGHIPESEVEVGVASLLPRVLPAALVGLVMVLVGGALLMRHVVLPIRTVAAAAAALERGDPTLEQDERLAIASASRDEVGSLAGAFRSMARSLADRDRTLREHNRELERHHRALHTLSECNEALVRASDERALFDAVCGVIVGIGGYRMCWVGLAEHDARKTVVPVAHAGHEAGYLSTADIVWDDTERGRGPVGTALRTGTPVVARSVASDPAFGPWAREAEKRGYRSVAAIPMVADGGVVLGGLAIYSSEVDAFDTREMRLLGELAGNLAYGVAALRGRTERLAMTGRLLQADRMVAVGTLAAGVAHEINNPLAYVVAALQFVESDLRTLEDVPAGRLHEMKQAVSEAREGARRVTDIVRGLKTFSRADEERSGPVELGPVIESAINMALNEVKHRARLVKDFRRTPPVRANEGRLGQVFLNLLINAAQAIPEGRMDENQIRVSTRTDECGRAVVEVSDTGEGIAPDVARHIFDPFFTTKPVGIGTGLGLFICRNIVGSVGGDIEVESHPGSGTVFRVTLPPSPGPDELARAEPAPEIVFPGRRGKVLVVDDEPAVGRAVKRLLQAEHEVCVLTSARDARDRIARGERFDAIICDLMMPVMTGIDLHGELAIVEPSQASRMVLLTGGAFTANAREFLERWPNPQLEKPVDAAALRAVVRTLVGQGC